MGQSGRVRREEEKGNISWRIKCRNGTEKALKLMKEKSWDIDLLKELSSAMMDASICGLGQAAPNPMLSVIKHFPSEVTN